MDAWLTRIVTDALQGSPWFCVVALRWLFRKRDAAPDGFGAVVDCLIKIKHHWRRFKEA